MPRQYLCQELTPLPHLPSSYHISISTPHHPAAQISGHLPWKMPFMQHNCHNLKPSNVPALVSKSKICLSVLTSDLIIDFQESIKKSFLCFIFCCWIQTSPNIYPLISMNNDKFWEITWSFIQSEVRPKPKLNTPQEFWRLYLDAGVWSHFPLNWFCIQDWEDTFSFLPHFSLGLHSLLQSTLPRIALLSHLGQSEIQHLSVST